MAGRAQFNEGTPVESASADDEEKEVGDDKDRDVADCAHQTVGGGV